MKGVIVYSGKYGATKQYAEWIGEELEVPIFAPGNLNTEQILKLDFIVIGTSVYIGKMLIGDWLKKNVRHLQNKILFLFIVCGSPPQEKEKQQHILEDNLPASLMNSCHAFFLPGRLIRKELSWSDRLLLRVGANLEKDPIKKNAMLVDIDAVKKENLVEMLNCIRSLTLQTDAVTDEDIPVYGSD